MDRRVFTTGALAVFAAPLPAQAPVKAPRIAVLGGTSPEVSPVLRGFFQRLRELGYVEGRNVVIEGRYYGDKLDQLPALAAELVALPVDVILAGAAPAPEAAKRATSAIPIVMGGLHPDPVGSGLVASLARPGGNVTGMGLEISEFRGKQLQLLKEAVPRLGHVAVLADPANPPHAGELRGVERAARLLKVRLRVLEVRAPGAFAEAFAVATREGANALLILGGSMFFTHRARLAELAVQSRLPAMHGAREFAVAINLKTAKALGLTIPPAVLARADQVIQ